MRRALNIIVPVLVLIVVSALLLNAGTGCAGKQPTPAVAVYYQIKQPAETSRQIITLLSAVEGNAYTTTGLTTLLYTYVRSPAGTVFVIIEVTVTNVGQGALGISRDDFSLKDSEGHQFASVGYKGANPYPNKKLASGQTASGSIAFVVPETVTNLEVSCVLQGSPPQLAVWQLPF